MIYILLNCQGIRIIVSLFLFFFLRSVNEYSASSRCWCFVCLFGRIYLFKNACNVDHLQSCLVMSALRYWLKLPLNLVNDLFFTYQISSHTDAIKCSSCDTRMKPPL